MALHQKLHAVPSEGINRRLANTANQHPPRADKMQDPKGPCFLLGQQSEVGPAVNHSNQFAIFRIHGFHLHPLDQSRPHCRSLGRTRRRNRLLRTVPPDRPGLGLRQVQVLPRQSRLQLRAITHMQTTIGVNVHSSIVEHDIAILITLYLT